MKYLILGAGPAGLTFANILKQSGEDSFLVLEKEKEAGGLCRSQNVDGFPFDIGGGHFLDVRRPNVNKFLFDFMPENEWNLYDRNSCISINNKMVSYPIEANIWQMKVQNQVEYLKSIAVAGCNIGVKRPNTFIDWIYWKLGMKIADDYMIPYNQKMFGKNLNDLGTYWLDKLPNVSFEESLLSCLDRKAYGTQPAHTQFYYPKKYGYGELWIRMADAIKNNLEYDKLVREINFNTRTIVTEDSQIYQADVIITTIPWAEFKKTVGLPDCLKKGISELKFSSVQTEYFPERLDTLCQWIYYPDLKLPYHRILVRHNFCPNSKGYWTETNSERITMKELNDNFKYMNKYAYPLNTIRKPEIVKNLLTWCRKKRVFGLGRWGEHQHYNSDVVVESAIKLAENIIKERKYIL